MKGFTGVLGKWDYIEAYDVYIGVNNINDVWLYKPQGWMSTALMSDTGDPGNTLMEESQPGLDASRSSAEVIATAPEASGGVRGFNGGPLTADPAGEELNVVVNTAVGLSTMTDLNLMQINSGDYLF